MDHPPLSTTTASSAPIQANFNGDSRIIAPLLAKNYKPLAISTSGNLYIESGLRRPSFPGNPVIVGTIYLADFPECRGPFCVTGDTDDEYNVTLSIQDKNKHGLPVSYNEELLQEAMKKAQELTQDGINEILEVEPEMWKKIYTPMPDLRDITGIEDIGEHVGNDPSWVRDNVPEMFSGLIKNYVRHTLEMARHEEFKSFTAIINKDGPAEIYKRCGWTDLAELDRAEVVRQLTECLNKLKMEGGQW